MFQATTTKTPARQAKGINLATGPNTNMISSSTMACTIPATGVRPPFLILVAVLAMAPVAGIPPSNPENTFAAPWATNSILERWRPPIMPSATTADNNDSILPNKAMAIAGWINACMVCMSISGITGMESLLGISPKLDSMVSTGRLNQFTTSVLRTMATIEPGILLDRREKFKDISTVPAAMANAVQLTRWKFSA